MSAYIRGLLLFIVVFGCHDASALSLTMNLATGYRQDNLDWNIAGNLSGTSPNVLSELTWKDLRSYPVRAGLEMTSQMRPDLELVLFKGAAEYGLIYSGNNQDSDYAGDNRTIEWSRSNSDAGDGDLLDLVGGAGVRYSPHHKWSLTPLFGYAYFEQNLVMRNGLQTVAIIPAPAPYPNPFPVGTTFPDLDSSYDAWWFGPWLGAEAHYQFSELMSAEFGLRYYNLTYRAEADWNLRTDLKHPVSFEHEADGQGVASVVAINYAKNESFSWDITFRYHDMQGEDGIDIVYFADDTIGGTRLNGVGWKSWSIFLSANYNFSLF